VDTEALFIKVGNSTNQGGARLGAPWTQRSELIEEFERIEFGPQAQARVALNSIPPPGVIPQPRQAMAFAASVCEATEGTFARSDECALG